jgi:hypothetical protein
LKSIFKNSSRSKIFYASRLSEHFADLCPTYRRDSLVIRALGVCDKRSISLVRYIYDDTYSSSQKRLAMQQPDDGLADCVKQLLISSQDNEL